MLCLLKLRFFGDLKPDGLEALRLNLRAFGYVLLCLLNLRGSTFELVFVMFVYATDEYMKRLQDFFQLLTMS